MRELKRIRNERGWSQQRLADESGVNKSTINQVEQGKRSPTIETLEKLADALDVEIADFFPKAQSPLPLLDAPKQQRGAEPTFTTYEALGRVLASRWKDDLGDWRDKVPVGQTPDEFDFARLFQWTLEIKHVIAVYKVVARDSKSPQREEFEDTLKLMEDTSREAGRHTAKVFEPLKVETEFQKIVETHLREMNINA